MVEDGESMFIWDWFYGFETPIDEIAGFAVTVESETSTYTEYQKIDAQGMMMDGASRMRWSRTRWTPISTAFPR